MYQQIMVKEFAGKAKKELHDRAKSSSSINVIWMDRSNFEVESFLEFVKLYRDKSVLSLTRRGLSAYVTNVNLKNASHDT